MNQLLTQYPNEVAQILAKYPPEFKKSAVMPLLHLAQSRSGFLVKQNLMDIAEITGLSVTDVDAVVGFYTLFHDDHTSGRYKIQVCTDLPCALRGADEFLAQLCENIGLKVGETSPDGLFTIEAVTCLAGCHHAPLFQVQGDGDITYHEDQTPETAMKVMDDLRRKAVEEAGK